MSLFLLLSNYSHLDITILTGGIEEPYMGVIWGVVWEMIFIPSLLKRISQSQSSYRSPLTWFHRPSGCAHYPYLDIVMLTGRIEEPDMSMIWRYVYETIFFLTVSSEQAL
jgi:hypothetical protein